MRLCIEDINRNSADATAGIEYIDVRDYIAEKIRSGEFRAGEALPEERELSLVFGLSRVTIRKAMKELADMRLVRRVRGKGTFVMDRLERVRTEFVGVTLLSVIHQAVIYNGINSVLRPHNRFAVTANYETIELEEEALVLQQLVEQGIGGLLVTPAMSAGEPHCDNMPLFEKFVQDGIPVVTIDRPLPEHKVSAVVFDQGACEKKSVEWLRLKKIEKFGYLGFHQGHVGKVKVRALREAADKAGYNWDVNRNEMLFKDEIESFLPERFGAEAISELLEKNPGMEALVCYSDSMASGALRYIKQQGLKHNIRMVLCGMNSGKRYLNRDILDDSIEGVGFLRNCLTIGSKAAKMLLKQMHDGIPEQPVIEYVPPQLEIF